MKLLLQTNDPTIIAFAQVLLDGEGIDSFVLDVHTSILEGGIGLLPRRLMVADRNLFLARSVMTDNGIDVVM
jgi:flagellar biosynthesis/type III secretory pathway ATPase